jgi:hypothetical protein
MAIELDHVFICVAGGGPEAEHLVEFGLCEGAPNVHPGQGTANRRFFFQNAMLELLWVEDRQEARSSQTATTLLWERWSSRQSGACPFGIVARPADTTMSSAPFPAREYRPEWLAPDLKIYLAPTGVEEPMWLFMPFLRRLHYTQRFVAHPNGAREITKMTLTAPTPVQSSAAQALIENAILSVREGAEYLLTIEFDKSMRKVVKDFRPELPLVVQL